MTHAMHRDKRILADQPKWGVVQISRSDDPDHISHWTRVRSVGLAAAAEVLLSGALFRGPDALRLGVATRCLPFPQVLPQALDFARDMAVGAAPLSLAMSKQILWTAADGTLADVDRLESEAHQLLMGRPDALEGGAAAFEKRP